MPRKAIVYDAHTAQLPGTNHALLSRAFAIMDLVASRHPGAKAELRPRRAARPCNNSGVGRRGRANKSSPASSRSSTPLTSRASSRSCTPSQQLRNPRKLPKEKLSVYQKELERKRLRREAQHQKGHLLTPAPTEPDLDTEHEIRMLALTKAEARSAQLGTLERHNAFHGSSTVSSMSFDSSY